MVIIDLETEPLYGIFNSFNIDAILDLKDYFRTVIRLNV